ncbi:hypothetical protein, partial [Actinotignum urinale]|uniref:hypothetical protein n=1 Tax=Actinotignum urinale TaxID=190146 RepID=UPI002A805CB2
ADTVINKNRVRACHRLDCEVHMVALSRSGWACAHGQQIAIIHFGAGLQRINVAKIARILG